MVASLQWSSAKWEANQNRSNEKEQSMATDSSSQSRGNEAYSIPERAGYADILPEPHEKPSTADTEFGGGLEKIITSQSAKSTPDKLPSHYSQRSTNLDTANTTVKTGQQLQVTGPAKNSRSSPVNKLWDLPEVQSQLADNVRTQVEIDRQQELLSYRLRATGIFKESYDLEARVGENGVGDNGTNHSTLRRQLVLDELNTFSQGLAAISTAIRELHTSNSRSAGFNIIIHTANRGATCQVEAIDLQTIEITQNCARRVREQILENHWRQKRSMKQFERVISALLHHLGFERALSPDSVQLPSLRYVLQCARILVQIMAIGLLSYVSSHTSRSAWGMFGNDMEVVLPIGFTCVDSSCTMKRIQLTCLDPFIGSEVNVFTFQSRMDCSRRYAISTLLSYFVELWGPVEIVPGHLVGTASQINTLGGVIRAHRQDSDDLAEGKIVCHWSSDGEIDGRLVKDTTLDRHDRRSQNSDGNLNNTAIDFDPTAELFIDAGVDIAQEPGRAFEVNEKCMPERQPSCGCNPNWEFVPTGPRDRKVDHTRTSYSAGLSKAPVTITSTRVYTKIAAVNAKNALLNHFFSPIERQCEEFPAEDLDQTVGLQISRCTLNGRRLSFWEILQDHAVREFIDTLYSGRILNECDPKWYEFENCVEWRNQVTAQLLSKEGTSLKLFEAMRQVIKTIMSRLEDTGPQGKHKIKAWDVEERSISWVFKSRWADFLRDGQNHAVFAFVSPTCLEYKHSSSCFVRKKSDAIPSILTRMTIKISVLRNGAPLGTRSLLTTAQDRNRNTQHRPTRQHLDARNAQSEQLEGARRARQQTLIASLHGAMDGTPALTGLLPLSDRLYTHDERALPDEDDYRTSLNIGSRWRALTDRDDYRTSLNIESRDHSSSAELMSELTRKIRKHPSKCDLDDYAWHTAHGALILDPVHWRRGFHFNPDETYRDHPVRSIWKTNTATSMFARHTEYGIRGLRDRVGRTFYSSEAVTVKMTYMETTKPTYKDKDDPLQATKYVCILDMDDFDADRLRKCESEPYMRLEDKRARDRSAADSQHQGETPLPSTDDNIIKDKGKAGEDDSAPMGFQCNDTGSMVIAYAGSGSGSVPPGNASSSTVYYDSFARQGRTSDFSLC